MRMNYDIKINIANEMSLKESNRKKKKILKHLKKT